MLDRLRRRGRDESGVVLVLVAIMLVVFLGMAAMAIDLGSFYGAQRKAQAAADAGALAAAGNLSTGTSAAQSAGTTYATTNYPGATPTVSTPYNNNANQVKVTVNASTPSFFGKIFGITKAKVSASAVAGTVSTGGQAAAIWAGGTSCSGTGINIQTTNLRVNGGVHSNGPMTMTGHNSSFGPGSYGGPNGCSYSTQTGDNVSWPAGQPTRDPVNETWPEDYTSYFPIVGSGSNPFTLSGDPNCTFVGSDLSLQSNNPQLKNGTLANGTYCYSTIEFNVAPITCQCTFVAASSFTFNSGNDNFTPYFKNKLLFYGLMSGGVTINANGDGFLNSGSTATSFFPNADVTINSPTTTMSGFLEAKSVSMNGGASNPVWNGTGPTIGATGTGGDTLLQ